MDNLDGDNQVTLNELVDIIDEEDELVESADAVLGGSDDQNCTYLMGYVNRQALYACKTCDQSGNDEPAGVCLACSLECHDGHDLIELYTKRNFRCDCGNGKFPTNVTCKLCPKKVPKNENNSYNQNFKGLYCICSKPYPDHDDSVEDVMIQCIICEDWFHGRHVSPQNVDCQDFEEMICSSCVEKNPFVWSYVTICKGVFESEKSDVAGLCDKAGEQTSDVKVDVVSEDDSKLLQANTLSCRLLELSSSVPAHHQNSAVFFPLNWRKQLCACPDCLRMCEEKGVAFLLHDGDSIAEYEEKGKACSLKKLYDDKVSTMSHVQKVELIRGYMDLKSSLSEYLKKFAENGKVVRQEDIAEFFTELEARKRQKTDDAQHFCEEA